MKISPENANIEGLEYCTSNNEIANLEKTEVTNDENKITLRVKPIAEGSCEVFVKSINGVESNKVAVKIIDNERIQAEEQAKKEAEEQAKKEAEEQSKKQAEEKKQAQMSSSSQSNKQQTAPTQKNTNSNNSYGKAVYRTPKGERYHYDPDCGGKNSYQTTWEAVKAAGLTPCQKCVH